MNFQDLLSKLKTLDESGQGVMAPPSEPELPECGDMDGEPNKMAGGDLLTGECGTSMMPMSAPKQSDSVTMNVSMNGSGSGGIKDLLDILRNIEKSGGDMPAGHDDDDVLFGIGKEGFDDATTVPDPQVAGMGAVIPTGDDMFSKGKEAPKVNGGGNPMREALIARLSEKYQTIKGN
jgi:hypothetical protein